MARTFPNFTTAYFDNSLVRNIAEKDPDDLASLDDKNLNDVIKAVDLIFRGVKDYSLNPNIGIKRLHPGHFGSCVQIARAWTFLDLAHSIDDVKTIVDKTYPITKASTKEDTGTKKDSFTTYSRNMTNSVIPRLCKNELINIDDSTQKIIDVMPYPISSKLYVKRELLDKGELYRQQINHFTILKEIQDFPELKNELQANSSNQVYFNRDYTALEEIDVIRTQQISGREFTLSKSYLTGEKSIDIWTTVLDTADNFRIALKDLLITLGDLGGFASQSELSIMCGLSQRSINQIIRRVDGVGLAQRAQTLELEDALSRPTSGTRLNSSYMQLNNAQSLLILLRSVPEAYDMLCKLETSSTFDEDKFIDEFDPISVGKVRNSLENIGVIRPDPSFEDKDIYEIVPNKECDKFLSDVLTVASHSRKILGDDINISKKMEDSFNKCDIAKEDRKFKQLTFDFLFEANREKRR